MVRKWKLGATGTALLATTFVVVACSSKSDDDSNPGSGNTSAKGGTGGSAGTTANAGKGGSGTGGSTGGTGGSTGGTAGTGTTTGGSGGMSTAGMGAGGMATGFGCPSPTVASCNYITNWGMFSNGMFGGGLYVYGDLKQDTTDTGEFHVTGTVTTYSGFGIYFNSCTDVSAYSNVTFTVAGTSANMQPVSLWYIIQQNSDEPVDTAGMKGDCTGMPGNPCQSPYTQFTVSASPQTIAFTSLLGGATMAPATTDGKFDPKQAIGMQWQFRPETAQAAGYAVDVKLDNLMFGSGTVMGSGGASAGGASAGGASSGGASSGGASSGGASSGGAGASAGGKAGSGAAGAANDVVTQIECTAAAMGGSGAGGAATGGASSGGASTGGASTGGATSGGMGGATGGQSNGGRGGGTAGGGGRVGGGGRGGGRGGQGGA